MDSFSRQITDGIRTFLFGVGATVFRSTDKAGETNVSFRVETKNEVRVYRITLTRVS